MLMEGLSLNELTESFTTERLNDLHLKQLQTRRSVRSFSDTSIPKQTLQRLIEAAITAPSPTNRQPWRFAIVSSAEKRRQICQAIKSKVEEIKNIIEQGHHANDFGNYGDFFHEPLESAPHIIIPQYRVYPDLIANFIASGGGDPSRFDTAKSMQAELCCTSAAVMALLLQAHAEKLGACWMSGPMVAQKEITSILNIKSPWKILGAIALGFPAQPNQPTTRKNIDDICQWHEE